MSLVRSTATVSGTTFTSCVALDDGLHGSHDSGRGGGMNLEYSTATVTATSYTACGAAQYGGGMHVTKYSTAVVSDTSYF